MLGMKVSAIFIASILILSSLGLSQSAFAQMNPGVSNVDLGPGVSALAHPGEELIDFETFPGGGAIPDNTRITNQFAPVGVDLFRTNAAIGPEIQQFGLVGQSGLNTLGGDGPGFQFFNPIGIDYGASVCEASFLGLDIGSHGLRVEAYNAGNVLVDSDVVLHPTDGAGVGNVDTLSVAGPDIVRMEIFQDNMIQQDDGYVIDDLRFTFCAAVGGEFVPMSSSALLLAGAQYSMSWMIPLLVAAAGFGIVIARKF